MKAYERCDMGILANGVKCGLVEWVKRNILMVVWLYGRKTNEEFVKKVYVSETGS